MALDAMIQTEDGTQTPPAAPKLDASKRTETFVWGIPQNGLQQKQREVQLDEPPPLPPNSELTYIGKPTVRYDGPAKAMGKGKYTADINLPGMLYARLVDATIPHGRILSIDTSAAEKLQVSVPFMSSNTSMASRNCAIPKSRRLRAILSSAMPASPLRASLPSPNRSQTTRPGW
jgi:hypothetical protein